MLIEKVIQPPLRFPQNVFAVANKLNINVVSKEDTNVMFEITKSTKYLDISKERTSQHS